jgi:hypothetical protein
MGAHCEHHRDVVDVPATKNSARLACAQTTPQAGLCGWITFSYRLVSGLMLNGGIATHKSAGSLKAMSERKRNGGRSSFDVIPRGCETNLGRHHVEPDRPGAA